MKPVQPNISTLPNAGPAPLPRSGRDPHAGKILPWIALVLLFWVPPAAWVTFCQPQMIQAGYPLALTQQRLATAGRALRGFLEKHEKAPLNFNILRAYARTEGLAFSSFDGYGQRFDYLRLDGRHYILRSFGVDAMQNTLSGAPDLALVSWGPRPEHSLSYKMPATTPHIGLYPAALLEGSDSPNGISHARLFADNDGLSRHLVVRLKDRGEFFMVAPHDRVEEFFWLPASNRIVYTATGSVRHRDGLYLWDLDKDTVENLIDQARGSLPISPAARGGGLWLSLAGITAHGPTVYAFAGLRHDGLLDPQVFFDAANLIAFEIPDNARPKVVPAMALKSLIFAPPYKKPLALTQDIEVKGSTPVQREWLKLTLDGNLEKILLNWHQFSERYADSPLFPYGLWFLSSVYGEGFELLSKLESKDAEVLRTFGTEIARALINKELAPTYLKSLALFTHEQLMDGLTLPYGMSRLTLPPATVRPTPTGTAPPPTTPKGTPNGKK